METHRKEDWVLGKSERDAQALEEKAKEKKQGKEEDRLVLSSSSYSMVDRSVPPSPVWVRLDAQKRAVGPVHMRRRARRRRRRGNSTV